MNKDALFLLHGLSEEEKARCWQMADCSERTYDKGQVLYDAHLARPALVLILDGCVRVLHRHVEMNRLHPGDVFGAAALFGEADSYVSRVEACTACRVLFLPQQTVSDWMAAMPRVAQNYVRFLSDRIRFLNRRLATLTAGQNDGKLWKYLQACQDEEGCVTLATGMTGLSKKLDMSRSSLYRSLDALQADGRIRRDGKCIFLLKQEEI